MCVCVYAVSVVAARAHDLRLSLIVCLAIPAYLSGCESVYGSACLSVCVCLSVCGLSGLSARPRDTHNACVATLAAPRVSLLSRSRACARHCNQQLATTLTTVGLIAVALPLLFEWLDTHVIDAATSTTLASDDALDLLIDGECSPRKGNGGGGGAPLHARASVEIPVTIDQFADDGIVLPVGQKSKEV